MSMTDEAAIEWFRRRGTIPVGHAATIADYLATRDEVSDNE